MAKYGVYMFEVDVDGGSAFQHTKVMTTTAIGYCEAEDNIMRKLREEYKNVIAFFNVKKYTRL